MALSLKKQNRVVVYFDDQQFIDLARCANRFDKTVGEYMRFGALQGMYGSLGMKAQAAKQNDSANECDEE